MKRILLSVVACSVMLCGCGKKEEKKEVEKPAETAKTKKEKKSQKLDFKDENTRKDLADVVYLGALESVDSSEYAISGVDVVYLSEEYVEELVYNTRENEYFGYQLSFLDEHFEEKPYVFTVNEKGNTVVRLQEDLEMVNIYPELMKNVAVTAGVIAVTIYLVPLIPAGTVTSVLLVGAADAAMWGAGIGAATESVIKGVQAANEEGATTEDIAKSMALGASHGMKVGAVTGIISNAAYNALPLKKMTDGGLSLKEAAKIQSETKWSENMIGHIADKNQLEFYKGLDVQKVNFEGREILMQKGAFDPSLQSNIDLMAKGHAPIGVDGKPLELHHMLQKDDAPLILMTNENHRKYSALLHEAGKASEIDRTAFNALKTNFYKKSVDLIQEGAFFE